MALPIVNKDKDDKKHNQSFDRNKLERNTQRIIEISKQIHKIHIEKSNGGKPKDQ